MKNLFRNLFLSVLYKFKVWVKGNYDYIKIILNLEEFHVFDSSKDEDIRKKFFVRIFPCMVIVVYFTFYVIARLFSPDMAYLIILILFYAIVVFFITLIATWINYRMYYILIPFLVFSIYASVLDLNSMDNKLLATVCIIGGSYTLTILVLPLYVIRKISSRSVIVGPLLTIVTTIILQSSNFFIKSIIGQSENFINRREIINNPNISKSVKEFILNPEVVDILDSFISIKLNFEFNSFISPLLNGMIISFLISGIIINTRISYGKKKAKSYLYDIALHENVTYSKLVKMVYFGGMEYEFFILGNRQLLEIVQRNEK